MSTSSGRACVDNFQPLFLQVRQKSVNRGRASVTFYGVGYQVREWLLAVILSVIIIILVLVSLKKFHILLPPKANPWKSLHFLYLQHVVCNACNFVVTATAVNHSLYSLQRTDAFDSRYASKLCFRILLTIARLAKTKWRRDVTCQSQSMPYRLWKCAVSCKVSDFDSSWIYKFSGKH